MNGEGKIVSESKMPSISKQPLPKINSTCAEDFYSFLCENFVPTFVTLTNYCGKIMLKKYSIMLQKSYSTKAKFHKILI